VQRKRTRRLTAALALTAAAITGLNIAQNTAPDPQDDTTWGAPDTADDTTWGTPPKDGGTTPITPLDTTWG
jgi:hypothetical protein